LNGDFVDNYVVSKFSKSKSKAEDLQWEFDVCHALLVQLRHAAPLARIDFIQGNHEERLIKYLDSRAKELRTLRDLAIERQLKLFELNINYVLDGIFLNDKFYITHGSKTQKQSAKAELDAIGVSGMSGHCHRTNTHRCSDILGNTRHWYSIGYLSIGKEMEYARNFWQNWNQGFAVIEYTPQDFYVTIIDVENRQFKYNGVIYEIDKKAPK
jgi:hypothetical protein